MNEPGYSPAQQLRQMIDAHRLSQAIATAAELGVADTMAEGPRTVGDIASAVGAHEAALYRLLRTLAAAGILHEGEGRVFALTDLGQALRRDHPASAAGWARQIGRPYFRAAWSNLPHSIRTGENAFAALNGEDVWSWRAARPEESAIFDAAMRSQTMSQAAAVVAAYDFSRYSRIVDIGGGNGALLAAILRACPDLRGVVFDQPHVAPGAEAVLAEAGVADRCEAIGGDMFASVPAGADAYILKSILHDWPDDRAIDILRVCRAAMPPHARVLLIEQIVGPPNEGLAEKLSDLNMLVMPGGQERTLDEWSALLASAGLRLAGVTRTGVPHAVIEAEIAP